MSTQIHPFALFLSNLSKNHTIEKVTSWLDGEFKDDQLSQFYQWFSAGLKQKIVAATKTTETTAPTTQGPIPVKSNIKPLTKPIPAPTPQPEGMKVVTNLQGADATHDNTWFPYKSILTVSTTDPDNTQFLDVEIRDEKNQLVEVDQIDPEFDHAHQIVHLKIQTSFEVLQGQQLKMLVNWADASNEQYSETTSFKCA